ncbi:HD domain-containing protein [archaeon]|jgi:uncharacterized protein|nr:HD domain-containing protein [archaeon]MBT7128419.1 HD domain-containing protein [archaeon]
MMNEKFFADLRKDVLPYFENGDGHGFDHVDRVYGLALNISQGESVDMDIVRASVLLHDVARSKEKMRDTPTGFKGSLCHAEEGAKMVPGILRKTAFPYGKIDSVVHSVAVHRYSKGLEAKTREAQVLQDADRLDALGAIILVRMVEATVAWGRPFYDPSIPIKDVYDGSKSTMINHIYEKILKITPDSFHTPKARELAVGRYAFVKDFAERYVGEVEGRM